MVKKKISFLFITFAFLVFFIVPSKIHGQTDPLDPPGCGTNGNPCCNMNVCHEGNPVITPGSCTCRIAPPAPSPEPGKNNTFKCYWFLGGCYVKDVQCFKGYEKDSSKCGSILNKDACESVSSFQCVSAFINDPMCNNNQGVRTAIGCIPVFGTTDDFLVVVLKWAVGIGGGIAFALMLYAGFMIMTSQGVPERLKAGQELMTSAIAGLILLVFSIFILKFIGVDILGLNQLGFNQ